jgi:hypothetical protein
MSQEQEQEPGQVLTESERERLIQQKMIELRAKRWEEEIEQEARRRLLEEERQEQKERTRKRRLQEEREIEEIEALLEEREEQERAAKRRKEERDQQDADADPDTAFYVWYFNTKKYLRNNKDHVFEYKEDLTDKDWVGKWPIDGELEAIPIPEEYLA